MLAPQGADRRNLRIGNVSPGKLHKNAITVHNPAPMQVPCHPVPRGGRAEPTPTQVSCRIFMQDRKPFRISKGSATTSARGLRGSTPPGREQAPCRALYWGGSGAGSSPTSKNTPLEIISGPKIHLTSIQALRTRFQVISSHISGFRNNSGPSWRIASPDFDKSRAKYPAPRFRTGKLTIPESGLD